MSPQSSAVVFDTDKIAEAVEKIAQTVSSDISYPEIPEELFGVVNGAFHQAIAE